MKSISVIIPVHNSERYLRECLDSISLQALPDMEFLCIEDSSTDQTREIIKEYKAKDGRFRMIIDPDSSYGHKINRGIEEASGKYIGIVESDDKVDQDMFATLFRYAEDNKADYVKSDFKPFVTERKRDIHLQLHIVNTPSFYKTILDISADPLFIVNVDIAIWTGIYNKSFLQRNQIRLTESPGASYQDTGFFFFTSLYAQRAYFLDEAFYWYRTDNAASSTKDLNKAFAIIEEFKQIREQLPEELNQVAKVLSALAVRKYIAYEWNLSRLEGELQEAFLEEIREELMRDWNDSNLDMSLLPADLKTFYDLVVADEKEALLNYNERNRKEKTRSQEIATILKSNKDVVLFGAGNVGRYFILLAKTLQFPHILALCDNNSKLWNTEIEGYSVISPAEAVARYSKADFVVAAFKHTDEMSDQLAGFGVPSNRVSICNAYANIYYILDYIKS
ncbi:glycosyltransferase [Paenibacillus spiritus]|uniref:Glycosyltransferase n=1 Tax=Paenibacillus spiritus TaxID=2496557 RepID=A0A5J5FVV8_9BACL|nr:glycosyltransferase [Paenibacillus spiritus]KAA8997969.1 glycosyltransferase [Paenibacillus spiritus]